MSISLIDVNFKGIKTFKNKEFSLDFRNSKRVYQQEKEDHVVRKLGGSNYLNNVIALVGNTASGKTTVLRLLDFFFKFFIQGLSLTEAADSSLYDLFLPTVTVNAHVVCADGIYRLETKLKKCETTGIISVQDENILFKPIKKTSNKSNFLDFSQVPDKAIMSRSKKSDEGFFIKEDDSLFPFILQSFHNEDFNQFKLVQSLWQTNFNVLGTMTTDTNVIDKIVSYLDNSIEYVKFIEPAKKEKITSNELKMELKFVNSSDSVIVPLASLDNYLSSGTIKGISLFSQIYAVLQRGSIILVDELENHLNKVIVEEIIDIFQSRTNTNDATLIFSTHYGEILDSVKRSEAIYVMTKGGEGIEVNRLSDLADQDGKDRTDIKSSDLVLSGRYGNAPSYRKSWELRKSLQPQAIHGHKTSSEEV